VRDPAEATAPKVSGAVALFGEQSSDILLGLIILNPALKQTWSVCVEFGHFLALSRGQEEPADLTVFFKDNNRVGRTVKIPKKKPIFVS